MDVGKDSNHAHIHHKEMMRSSGESVQSENHHMQHAMKVWFHGGYNEVILFQFWSVNSYTGLLLSCALIFVMASLYEGIKWFRIHLQISRESRMSVSYRTSSNAQKMLEYGVLNGPDSRGDHSEPVVIHNQPREKNNYSPFSIMRITQKAMQYKSINWLAACMRSSKTIIFMR